MAPIEIFCIILIVAARLHRYTILLESTCLYTTIFLYILIYREHVNLTMLICYNRYDIGRHESKCTNRVEDIVMFIDLKYNNY